MKHEITSPFQPEGRLRDRRSRHRAVNVPAQGRGTRIAQAVLGLLAALVAMSSTGCATRQFVRQEIDKVHHQTENLESRVDRQIEGVQSRIATTDARVAEQGEEILEVSETAREALDRAIEAGKLAEGKLLYETTFSDANFKFDFDKADLSEPSRAALDELAARLKSENSNIYLEIQGHTDATGPETYNLTLGERRAGNVSRYLSMEHGIPLHRMATISYGESSPVADNESRDGRSQNRRVVVVVLQ